MAATIPEQYKDLFQKKAFCSLATLMPDGRPQVTPVWCDLEGSNIRINSAKGRVKDRNMRRNKKVRFRSSTRTTPTAICRCRAKWSISRSRAQTRTSTRWRKNIWAKISTRFDSPERCASSIRFDRITSLIRGSSGLEDKLRVRSFATIIVAPADRRAIVRRLEDPQRRP